MSLFLSLVQFGVPLHEVGPVSGVVFVFVYHPRETEKGKVKRVE